MVLGLDRHWYRRILAEYTYASPPAPTPLAIMVTSSPLKSVALFAIGAAAHGAVTSYKIAGTDYAG